MLSLLICAGDLRFLQALPLLTMSILPLWGFSGGSDSKESACNARDLGIIPELGRFPDKGNGYPLHCFYLENSMDRRAWWDRGAWGSKESDTTLLSVGINQHSAPSLAKLFQFELQVESYPV